MKTSKDFTETANKIFDDGDLLYIAYRKGLFSIPQSVVGTIKIRKNKISRFFLGSIKVYASPDTPFEYQNHIENIRWKNVTRVKVVSIKTMFDKFLSTKEFFFPNFASRFFNLNSNSEDDSEEKSKSTNDNPSTSSSANTEDQT